MTNRALLRPTHLPPVYNRSTCPPLPLKETDVCVMCRLGGVLLHHHSDCVCMACGIVGVPKSNMIGGTRVTATSSWSELTSHFDSFRVCGNRRVLLGTPPPALPSRPSTGEARSPLKIANGNARLRRRRSGDMNFTGVLLDVKPEHLSVGRREQWLLPSLPFESEALFQAAAPKRSNSRATLHYLGVARRRRAQRDFDATTDASRRNYKLCPSAIRIMAAGGDTRTVRRSCTFPRRRTCRPSHRRSQQPGMMNALSCKRS